MRSRGTTSRTCISQPAGGTGALSRIRPIVMPRGRCRGSWLYGRMLRRAPEPSSSTGATSSGERGLTAMGT